MKLRTIPFLSLVILSGLSFFTPALAIVNIDYVFVGDAGNANDPATRSLYGAVSYAYQIAKNETTIAQYAEFLNAVAATDTYSLYNTGMTTSFINGISRAGVTGGYTYTVNPGSGNKPITYVSWFDAARFTNWLHHGQPTGLQTAGTTEDGAYTLLGAISGTGFIKNEGAKAWIPTESEWYKAAYYDPNKGGPGVGGYWQQANQSDTVTGNTIGVARSANYFDGNYVGSGTSSFPTANALTDVGAYGLNSDSAYGTNDQGGNVSEWNDAVIFDSFRGLRGGDWTAGPPIPVVGFYLSSFNRVRYSPTNEIGLTGFRVASVPEPSSAVLTMLSIIACLAGRRRSSL